MTAPYRLSRIVLSPVLFECWQAGEVAPIDCTGFTGAVEMTTLPWIPAVVAIAPVLGQFKLAAPSVPQAALLVAGKRYGAKVVFRNGAGAAVLDFDLELIAQ